MVRYHMLTPVQWDHNIAEKLNGLLRKSLDFESLDLRSPKINEKERIYTELFENRPAGGIRAHAKAHVLIDQMLEKGEITQEEHQDAVDMIFDSLSTARD